MTGWLLLLFARRTPGHIAKEYSFDDLIDILNKAVREKRLEELEAKGVNSWTSKEVGEWIESVGYPQYSTHAHPPGSSPQETKR